MLSEIREGARALLAMALSGLGCSAAASTAPVSAAADGKTAEDGALPGGDRARQLALGEAHTCALLESGRVACWGDNGRGQLGNGSEQPSASPVLVPQVFDVVEIRAGWATTCARTQGGEVLCWGDNAYGQAHPEFDSALAAAPTPWGVYDSRGEPSRFSPAHVLRSARSSVVAGGARSISLGYGHSCGAYDTGEVKCWGDASRGQLGVPMPGEAFRVQAIDGVPRLVEVASALFYSCGRTADGGVWCWGANDQLQLGAAAPMPYPRQVPGIRGARALQLAGNRACAWLDGGRVMCWGDSLECGDDRAQLPALAPELERDVQFVRAPGECFWCVLDAGHTLACDGDPIAGVRFDMANVSSVAAGNHHACATKLDGSVWCWGGNPHGELGRHTADVRAPEPAPVPWPSNGGL